MVLKKLKFIIIKKNKFKIWLIKPLLLTLFNITDYSSIAKYTRLENKTY